MKRGLGVAARIAPRSKSLRMDQNSRKRKPEENLEDEEHEVKQRKEFETCDDLEELMKSRIY